MNAPTAIRVIRPLDTGVPFFGKILYHSCNYQRSRSEGFKFNIDMVVANISVCQKLESMVTVQSFSHNCRHTIHGLAVKKDRVVLTSRLAKVAAFALGRTSKVKSA